MTILSIAEKIRQEGRAEGKAEVMREFVDLIKSGMSADEALQVIGSRTSSLQQPQV